MLRYLLVLFATTSCIAWGLTDTPVTLSIVKKLPDDSKSQNLNPIQQYIYIYGPQQWKMKNVDLVDKAAIGYFITPGMGAHKLHTRKLPWNKARKICIQEGGHLAVINSNSEEKILLRILDENKVDQAWLGVHDLYEEGDWNTIMDEPLETTGYSRWTLKYRHQPDNYQGIQHCGLLLKEGGMDDFECDGAHSFFCKITSESPHIINTKL